MPQKRFIVVPITDMPENVRRAFIDYTEGHTVWGNGTYVPFDNWQNTEEGSCDTALVVERWLEETQSELKYFRVSGKQLKEPVLIAAFW